MEMKTRFRCLACGKFYWQIDYYYGAPPSLICPKCRRKDDTNEKIRAKCKKCSKVCEMYILDAVKKVCEKCSDTLPTSSLKNYSFVKFYERQNKFVELLQKFNTNTEITEQRCIEFLSELKKIEQEFFHRSVNSKLDCISDDTSFTILENGVPYKFKNLYWSDMKTPDFVRCF